MPYHMFLNLFLVFDVLGLLVLLLAVVIVKYRLIVLFGCVQWREVHLKTNSLQRWAPLVLELILSDG